MNTQPLPSMLLIAALITAAPSWASDLNDLQWLSGHWQSSADGGWSEEHWLPPRGGVMLGVNRSGSAKGRVSFEFLRIALAEDGTPVYWASPGGQPAVPFRLDQHVGSSATFVNPEHDYPARIHYQRDGDRLQATISAMDGSSPMHFEWRRGD